MAWFGGGTGSAKANTGATGAQAVGSWTNPYNQFYGETGDYKRKYLDKGLAFDPSQMGWGQFGSQFGITGGPQVRPNDPNIGGWMNNLQGGQQALINQNARTAANAGVASGRGGMGVAGGVNPGAMNAYTGNQALANMYGQNYGQAVGWEMQNADRARGLYGDYLGALGNYYGDVMNTGLGLSGQQLQANQSADASKQAYDRLMQGYWEKAPGVAAQELANRRGEWDFAQQQERYPGEMQAQKRQRALDEAIRGREATREFDLMQAARGWDSTLNRGGYSYWPGPLALRMNDYFNSQGKRQGPGQSSILGSDRMFD